MATVEGEGKTAFLKDVLTGVLQTSPRLRKIQGAVDHFARTTPVVVGQGFGRFINSRMTV